MRIKVTLSTMSVIAIFLLPATYTTAPLPEWNAGFNQTPARSISLPPDVSPDSRSRLPLLKRDDMKDEESRRIYDSIVGPGGNPPGGTIAVALYSPKTAVSIRAMNEYLRRKSSLGDRMAELIILITAREINQRYEWAAHEPAALRAGLEPAVIDIVRNNRPVTGLGEKDAAIIQFGRQLFREKKVAPEIFAKAVQLFGRRGTFDAILLIGHYTMAGVMKHAANQQPAEGWDPAKLPVIPGVGTPSGEPGKFVDPPQRGTVPPDVDRESRYRFPFVKRDELDAEGKSILDRVLGPERANAGGGPVGMAFNSPALVDPIHNLNVDLRDNGVLGQRLAEIVIAATGREMNSQYQWAVHSAAAARAGASAALLDIIKFDKELTGLDEKDALAIEFTRQLVRTNAVRTDTWTRAVAAFGTRGVVEISELVGDYLMVTMMYSALDMRMAPNQEPTLPHRVGAPLGVAP